MIQFKELHLQNFRSWKELHITDFNKKGLCNIEGSNGSGKSSIRQAIEYLLTDSTSDDLSLDELPFDKGKNCVIQGIFEKDGQQIEITKYRNHNKQENAVSLVVDGDSSLTTPIRKETQRNIERLLGITSDSLYLSTIFSHNTKSFPFCTEGDRKQFLYASLRFEEYNKYQSIASDKVKVIGKEITKYDNTIIALGQFITEMGLHISQTKIDEGTYNENRKQKITKLLMERLDAVQLLSDTSTIENEIKLLELDYKKLDDDVVTTIAEEMELVSKSSKLGRDLDYLHDKQKNLNMGLCPILNTDCIQLRSKSTVDAKQIETEINTVRNTKLKISEKLDEIGELKQLKQKIERENSDLEHKISALEHTLKDILHTNSYCKSKIDDIDGQISELSSTSGNPYTEMLVGLNKKLVESLTEKDSLAEKIKSLQLEVQYDEFWEVGFGRNGIPNMKLDGFLEEVENLTNNYLSMTSKDMIAEISAQKELKSGGVREEISYRILSPNKKITNPKSYSGGERQRIRVADILAFNELLSKFDIIILDEVLELSLDTSGKNSVSKLLRQKANDLGSIFIMTHSGTVQENIDNVLNVRKVNGISTLVGG